MKTEKQRFKIMMAYLGWEPKDIATITGYSIHSVYHQTREGVSSNLMDAVKRFEEITNNGNEYHDFSSVAIEQPALNQKGWSYLIKHLNRCDKSKTKTKTILGHRL